MNGENVDVELIEINFGWKKFNLGFRFEDRGGVECKVARDQWRREEFMYSRNLLF